MNTPRSLVSLAHHHIAMQGPIVEDIAAAEKHDETRKHLRSLQGQPTREGRLKLWVIKRFFLQWPRAWPRAGQAAGTSRGTRAAGRGSGGGSQAGRHAAGRGPRAATAPGLQKEWVRAKPQTRNRVITLKGCMGGCETLNPNKSEWLRKHQTLKGVGGCETLRNPHTPIGVRAKPQTLNGVGGCETRNPKRSMGAKP